MRVTWRALGAFTNAVGVYLAQHPGDTKFAYAAKRVQDQVAKCSEQLQGRMTDIEIDLCVVDEKDVIQRDEKGNLQFTRAGLKERNQRQLELLDEEFEIEPHITATPGDLTGEQYSLFSGLLIAGGVLGADGDSAGDNAGEVLN
jgi:hypothetical protein